MLEIKILIKYIALLEQEIRKIYGDTSSTNAMLKRKLSVASVEAEREYRVNMGKEDE